MVEEKQKEIKGRPRGGGRREYDRYTKVSSSRRTRKVKSGQNEWVRGDDSLSVKLRRVFSSHFHKMPPSSKLSGTRILWFVRSGWRRGLRPEATAIAPLWLSGSAGSRRRGQWGVFACRGSKLVGCSSGLSQPKFWSMIFRRVPDPRSGDSKLRRRKLPLTFGRILSERCIEG